jgi:dipeptidyl-peptidase 4
MRIRLLPLVLALSWLPPAIGQEAPRTVAEASSFARTASGAEVEAFLKGLAEASPRVRTSSIGKTHEGRDIPLAIIADPPVETPAQASRSGKTVVLLIGGIHSGECDSKEALLSLSRELATYKRPSADAEPEPADVWKAATLRRLVVLVVPNYNVDGNEKLGKGKRPGQVGPEETGQRENAQNLDLIRDFVKLGRPKPAPW